jgi:hypothetical protein
LAVAPIAQCESASIFAIAIGIQRGFKKRFCTDCVPKLLKVFRFLRRPDRRSSDSCQVCSKTETFCGGNTMKASLWLVSAVSAGLAIGLAFGAAPRHLMLGPTSAFAQDDNNADYQADQTQQRDEDAEQQQRYQQEQQEQQQENARQQNEYNREQEEQRHQDETDRLNSEHEEQEN